MKILYLHGLDSPLTSAKREILEKYGTVLAPDINYRVGVYINSLLKSAQVADVIVGSSMGGYTGALLSLLYNKPALLFNPAFVHRSYNAELSKLPIPADKNSYTKIVLGKQDDMVVFKDNLDYIGENFRLSNLKVSAVEGLGHRIPEDIFEEEVKVFVEELKEKAI